MKKKKKNAAPHHCGKHRAIWGFCTTLTQSRRGQAGWLCQGTPTQRGRSRHLPLCWERRCCQVHGTVLVPPLLSPQHSPRWESGPGQNLSHSSCTAPEAFPRSLQGHFQLWPSDSLLLTPNLYAAIWTSSAGFKHMC